MGALPMMGSDCMMTKHTGSRSVKRGTAARPSAAHKLLAHPLLQHLGRQAGRKRDRGFRMQAQEHSAGGIWDPLRAVHGDHALYL